MSPHTSRKVDSATVVSILWLTCSVHCHHSVSVQLYGSERALIPNHRTNALIMKSAVGFERALIPHHRTNALIMESVKQVLRYLCAQGGAAGVDRI